MKVKISITILLLGVMSVLSAQHLPQYTQYQFNDYAINPAIGGVRPYFDVRSSHRSQWVGITDAPRTYTLTMNGPLKNPNMGLGGFLYTDNVGPTRRTGFTASYAYNMQVSSKNNTRISFGLAFGITQFLVDVSKITLLDADDPSFGGVGTQSATMPDATFGVYLYSDNYYFGISLPNLLQNKIYFFDKGTETLSKLEDHYYIAGGYTFNLSDDFDAEASVMIKYVKPVPIQPEFTGRVIYKDMLWVGAGFRIYDAASFMVGYTFRESLSIGYSYDYPISSLNKYSSGTHEIMIGIKFLKPHVAEKTATEEVEDI